MKQVFFKNKIGVLTFNFSNNYGAQLQLFALVSLLKKLGYNPYVIDIRPRYVVNGLSLLKQFQLKFNQVINSLFAAEFVIFRKSHYKLISKQAFERNVEDSDALSRFNCVIVGSDQVWRLDYTKNLGYQYFLDFVPSQIPKIAYAASFGTDKFVGSNSDIERISNLLNRFKAISVREDSGVNICRSIFGVEAEHLLDPTLLLLPEDYESLMIKNDLNRTNGDLAMYFLDETEDKLQIVNRIAEIDNLKILNLTRKSRVSFSLSRFFCSKFSDYYYPSFSKWLSGIRNARFIVTDSFHGVVFSIVFNKQFVCISNPTRGNARMESLLEQTGLNSRMVVDGTTQNEVEALLRIPIDYIQVNETLKYWREKSYNFLHNAISN